MQNDVSKYEWQCVCDLQLHVVPDREGVKVCRFNRQNSRFPAVLRSDARASAKVQLDQLLGRNQQLSRLNLALDRKHEELVARVRERGHSSGRKGTGTPLAAIRTALTRTQVRLVFVFASDF